MQYRRAYSRGGCYFFTLVTHQRNPILCDDDTITVLRNAFKNVIHKRPFSINAMVVLPDHLHCIWTLPKDDHDFSTRWRLVKTWFTKHSVAHRDAGGGKIWQNRYWEHLIRNEKDFQHHVDYIHYNPVKHGCVNRVSDWQYSSFLQFVKAGLYDEGWGVSEIELPAGVGKE